MSRNKPGEDEATETYAQAAQRLLRVLEQRAKKASGGVRPEQIPTGSVRVPARADEADGGQSQGVAANCNHRPHPLGRSAAGEGDGQIVGSFSFEVSGEDCPSSPDDIASADRAKVTLRADLK